MALIPYIQEKRASGKSSYNFFRYFNQAMQTFVSVVKFLLRFATVMGFALSGISILVGIIYYIK